MSALRVPDRVLHMLHAERNPWRDTVGEIHETRPAELRDDEDDDGMGYARGLITVLSMWAVLGCSLLAWRFW